MRLIRKISSSCEDKNCPAVWETDEPGRFAVVGDQLTGEALDAASGAAGLAPHEGIVIISADLLRQAAAGL